MKQYEIRWADMPKPIGRRPVVLLSRTTSYGYLNKVIVAEITTTIRSIPQEVLLGPSEGLSAPCVVNFDNIHVVAKTVVGEAIGTVPRNRYRELKCALGHALDWHELKVL